MDKRYIAALIAFAGGALISLINALITAKQVSSDKETNTGSYSIIRQVVSILFLTGTYLVVRKVGIEPMLPLIGAAIGLTVPAILFTITIAKHIKGDH